MKNFFKNLFKKKYPERTKEKGLHMKRVYAGPEQMGRRNSTEGVYAGPEQMRKRNSTKCVYAGPEMMDRNRFDSIKIVYAGPPTGLRKNRRSSAELEDVYMGPEPPEPVDPEQEGAEEESEDT